MNTIKHIFFVALLTTSYNASGMFGFGKYIFDGTPNQRQQYVSYNKSESQKHMPDGLFGLGNSFSNNTSQPTPTNTPTMPTNNTPQTSKPMPPRQKTRIIITGGTK